MLLIHEEKTHPEEFNPLGQIVKKLDDQGLRIPNVQEFSLLRTVLSEDNDEIVRQWILSAPPSHVKRSLKALSLEANLSILEKLDDFMTHRGLTVTLNLIDARVEAKD